MTDVTDHTKIGLKKNKQQIKQFKGERERATVACSRASHCDRPLPIARDRDRAAPHVRRSLRHRLASQSRPTRQLSTSRAVRLFSRSMQTEELDVTQVQWDHSQPVMQSEDLIEEVRKRPGLWDPLQPTDRIDKLNLWKEVGSALFDDWQKLNKAVAYDRVLQIQKKWRSLKDAYNRELRARRRGIRVNRRVYIHFKNLAFLGGFEGLPGPNKRPFEASDEDAADNDHSDDAKWLDPPDTPDSETIPDPDPLVLKKTKRKPKRKQKYAQKPEEIEMPMFLNEMREQNNDSDKLFLLSFSQELRKLPPSIKMWARAQIANVMQEAVNCHFNNTQPRSSEGPSHVDIKRPRHSSSD